MNREKKKNVRFFICGQFQNLCEFVEIVVCEDTTYSH